MRTLTSRVLAITFALGALGLATACTPAASPTPSPTAATKATATVATTPTAAPKAAATATATAIGGPVQTPRLSGVIDSTARCFTENDIVKTLDLPRQILSLTPARVKDGDTVTLTAAGYRPRTAVEVRVFAPGTTRISQALGQMLTDEAGRASGTFTLPSVRAVNVQGDTTIPVCLGVVLWSPSEQAGSTLLVVPEQ